MTESFAEWVSAPRRLRLADRVVDVWRADLADRDEQLVAALSPDERERAGRFVDPAHGRRWARARGILRALLGRYLDADPAGLRFVEGEHGKPALAGPEAGAGLEFNLSHSENTALYAFARGRAVGVDIELARRRVDAVVIARRMLGADAAAALATIEDTQARGRAFLRLWSRREAALKCRGIGIGHAPSAGVVPEDGLWIVALDVGPDGAAALAVEGRPRAVRRFVWRD